MLSTVLDENGFSLPGVNEAYLYFGMYRSVFAWCVGVCGGALVCGGVHVRHGVVPAGMGCDRAPCHPCQPMFGCIVFRNPCESHHTLMLSSHTPSGTTICRSPHSISHRHTEDLDLYSINYLHYGANKQVGWFSWGPWNLVIGLGAVCIWPAAAE